MFFWQGGRPCDQRLENAVEDVTAMGPLFRNNHGFAHGLFTRTVVHFNSRWKVCTGDRSKKTETAAIANIGQKHQLSGKQPLEGAATHCMVNVEGCFCCFTCIKDCNSDVTIQDVPKG